MIGIGCAPPERQGGQGPGRDVSESADQEGETSLSVQKPRYLSAKTPAECMHFSSISLRGSGKLNGAICRFIGRHSPVEMSTFAGKRVKVVVSR